MTLSCLPVPLHTLGPKPVVIVADDTDILILPQNHFRPAEHETYKPTNQLRTHQHRNHPKLNRSSSE